MALASASRCRSPAFSGDDVQARQLAEVVEGHDLAVPRAEVAMQLQGLVQVRGGRFIAAGLQMRHAELVKRPGLTEPVTQLPPQCQPLMLVRQRGLVVAG